MWHEAAHRGGHSHLMTSPGHTISPFLTLWPRRSKLEGGGEGAGQDQHFWFFSWKPLIPLVGICLLLLMDWRLVG